MGRLEKNDIRGKIWEPFGTQEGSGELCVWEIRKIGKFRSWEIAKIRISVASGDTGNSVIKKASGDWEKSLYVAEVRNAAETNARSADELEN